MSAACPKTLKPSLCAIGVELLYQHADIDEFDVLKGLNGEFI